MTLSANVAIAFSNKFYVKVKGGEIKGRGIKETSCSIPNTKKYLVTETAFNKLQKTHNIDFKNVIS